MSREDIISRFYSKVHKSDGCWIWTASTQHPPRLPYGLFRLGKQRLSAHRVAWMLDGKEIPKGMLVLHHCDNPKCVRIDHLFLGTNKDNTQDAMRKGRLVNPPRLLGEANHKAKLTEADVLWIRKNYKFGDGVRFADKFGVSSTMVHDIVRMKNWRHL